jgi:V/A-type H+-transporting ATPase subunit F
MPEGRIAFLGDIDSVLGFRALGVETIVPDGPDSARETFRRLVRQETSVIMITEDLLDVLQEQIDETLNSAVPAVVVLPGITGTRKRGVDTIRELIIRAVGVDLMAEDQ